AAAKMHADVHVLWRGGEHPIGNGDVLLDQRAPVIAARRQHRLHLRIAEFGKSGLVDLDVTAAGFSKGVKLARERFHDIGPELIHIPVSARQYRSVSTAKVQCAGPRNRNFWPAIRMAFEETYVGGIDRTGPLHVATDNRNRLRTTAALSPGADGLDAADRVDPQSPERGIEKAVIGPAAEFTVSDEFKAEPLLQADHLGDGSIFGRCERSHIDL